MEPVIHDICSAIFIRSKEKSAYGIGVIRSTASISGKQWPVYIHHTWHGSERIGPGIDLSEDIAHPINDAGLEIAIVAVLSRQEIQIN